LQSDVNPAELSKAIRAAITLSTAGIPNPPLKGNPIRKALLAAADVSTYGTFMKGAKPVGVSVEGDWAQLTH
jgi:hypothetical protein